MNEYKTFTYLSGIIIVSRSKVISQELSANEKWVETRHPIPPPHRLFSSTDIAHIVDATELPTQVQKFLFSRNTV